MSLLWDLTTLCYSYAKIVTTKSYKQLNQCLAFEPDEPRVILAEYEMYLLLGILNIITKSRLSSLNLVTVPKMPNLSLTPLKPFFIPSMI